MRTFNVLLVDDEYDSQIKDVVNEFQNECRVKVFSATNLKDAREIIREQFLHLSLIDLHLDKNSKMEQGYHLFIYLRENRPTCKRILITKHTDTNIFKYLDPYNPLIHGAIDKTNSVNYIKFIKVFALNYFKNEICIKGLEYIYEKIIDRLDKNIHEDKDVLPKYAIDEIDYLLSSILGQKYDVTWDRGVTLIADQYGSKIDDLLKKEYIRDDDCIYRIDLKEMTGGRSKSVVFFGRPESKKNIKGTWCVFKISSKKDIQEEYSRYDRYMKFKLSLDWRVEHLGNRIGDTLGIICYSFAGKSPEKIKSLEELLLSEDKNSIGCLKKVYSIKKKELSNRPRIDNKYDLSSYFDLNYNLEARSVLDAIKEFLYDKLYILRYFVKEEEYARFYECINDAVAKTSHRRFLSTIIHGDLNSGNIVVADDIKDIILIDYRHTGKGPVYLDFASLECSLRLAPYRNIRCQFTETCSDIGKIIGDLELEKILYHGSVDGMMQNRTQYWFVLSRQMIEIAKNTIKMNNEFLIDYTSICLLWALRIYKVKSITNFERLRLIIWMIALSEIINNQD